MPSRLRRTRSSAFRAHTISSPSKTAGRPAKKLKLDRSGVSVSAKSVLEGSDVDEDDDEDADEDEDENEDEADGDDDVDEEFNSDEGQENIDPTTDNSSVNPGAGPSRRRLRNGKNVLKRLRSRRQRRPAALTTASAYNHSYSPRKRKRDDPEYTDEDEDDEDRASGEEYTDDEAEVGSDEQAEAGLGEGIEEEDDDEGEDVDVDVDDSAEPDYIDENDEHLLREAPAWTLRRLKKAELKRLWLVAGLWDAEDGMGGDEEGEVADGLTKDVLVEGIIKARPPSSASTASSSTRRIAKLPPGARDSVSRDSRYNTPVYESPVSAVEEEDDDDEQQASQATSASQGSRGQGRSRLNGNAENRSIASLRNGNRTRHSTGSAVNSQDNKRAHFDVNLQSPAQTYRHRRGSHASSAASSSVASRDGSPKRNGVPLTPRPLGRRGKGSRKSVNFDEEADEAASESGSVSTAGDEDDSHDDHVRTRQNGRSLGKRGSRASLEMIQDEGEEPTAATGKTAGKRRSSLIRHTPARRAARKAVRAMHDQLDTDEDENMEATDVEESDDESPLAGSDDPTPRPNGGRIATRARSSTMQSNDSSPLRRRNRRLSTSTLLTSPETDSSRRSSLTSVGRSSDDEEQQDDMASSSQQSARRRKNLKRPNKRRDSGYNLRRNDSSGFDLDARLGGIDLTDDDDTAMEADKVDENEDVEMTEQMSEDTEMPDDSAHEDEHGEDGISDEMLATATQATLRKLKKAVLVEMCEARELDTEGTKEQLSQWLIEWRDSTSRSTSSASTARPETPTNESSPATKTHSGRKKISVPKLLQDHSEVADPNTPAHSHGDIKEDVEADGALDLEELGLVDKEIPVEQIQKGDKIGSGGFKDVFIGKLRGRVKVAVCEFRDELSEMDIRELKLLAEFKHPNIVRLLGIAIPERSLHIPCMVVTELCEKGDLFDYIRNVDLPPVNKVLKMMLDIAQGLTYLHDRNPRVIHRDCKSSNILITNRGVCKVGDFGLARVKNTTRSVIRSLVGTVNWQAPELWSPKPRYDYKVDVFSCAMVFWEMLAGWLTDKKKYPWEGENEHWIYLNVGQNKVRPETEPLTEHWGSDLVNLMERMWHHDPNERPLMSDVVDDLTAIMEARRRA